MSSPRFQNLRAEYLSGRAISLSEDAVAILDRTAPKAVRVCDVNTGRPLADGKASEVAHDCEVVRESGKINQRDGFGRSSIKCERPREKSVGPWTMYHPYLFDYSLRSCTAPVHSSSTSPSRIYRTSSRECGLLHSASKMTVVITMHLVQSSVYRLASLKYRFRRRCS